jgi:hypothetical protein
MSEFKKAYSYLFYKMYKHFESGPSIWLSDWKASFSILVLEIWLCLSGLNYYSIFFKKAVLSDTILTVSSLCLVVFLAAIKYIAFEYQDRWKKVVNDFDELPKNKNKAGTYIVLTVILIIIANLIFSFFLLSKVDWQLYK